jgi:hypothetical protein
VESSCRFFSSCSCIEIHLTFCRVCSAFHFYVPLQLHMQVRLFQNAKYSTVRDLLARFFLNPICALEGTIAELFAMSIELLCWWISFSEDLSSRLSLGCVHLMPNRQLGSNTSMQLHSELCRRTCISSISDLSRNLPPVRKSGTCGETQSPTRRMYFRGCMCYEIYWSTNHPFVSSISSHRFVELSSVPADNVTERWLWLWLWWWCNRGPRSALHPSSQTPPTQKRDLVQLFNALRI